MSKETFRLPRSFQGIFFAAFFSLVVIFYASLPLLICPPQGGFETTGSVLGVAFMGVAIFGSMALLACYSVLSDRRTFLSIEGTTIAVRTVLQNVRFEVAELQQLVWRPSFNKLRFRVNGKNTHLNLLGFSAEDRLRIIRLLWKLVPADKQQNWPQYCQKIAIPLRQSLQQDPNRPLEPDEILVTRGRYDRAFLVIFPFAMLGSVVAWRLGYPNLLVFPVFLLLFWLFLRYQIPQAGWRQTRISAELPKAKQRQQCPELIDPIFAAESWEQGEAAIG